MTEQLSYSQIIGQDQAWASGRGSDDAVGNSPGVRQELIEGIGSLLGWCKEVRWKKAETRQKIVECIQKGLSGVLGQGLDDTVGARREFTRTLPKVSGRSLGTRREIARNTPGDRRRKTVRLVTGNARGCRITGVKSLSLMVMYDCNP
ncbi:hypothetical protein B296_00020539 [Ensete ventricosum]|uniref:Uncharacterized protein n=1 Tax=Ensete ventricosum TaxID=4639 RepID=A0A426XJH3_ENSVE|nr:hypothetical protein B296_00020539 [Ensete ventricosum]